jgi:HAD superfamily hydrolase (TIGR01450 family)
MTALLAQHAETLRSARALLFDWDGCLAEGRALVPGAVDLLHHAGPRAWILSNNSTDRPSDFAELLDRAGVALPAERILLAGHATVALCAERWPGGTVHMVAHARMKTFARQLGLKVEEGSDRPQAVVLMRDPRFSYARLLRAVAALRRGTPLVVANLDRTHPGGSGVLVPETGALLAAIGACIDLSTIPMEVVGKPEPRLFEMALGQAGVRAGEAVMVGDNPETDLAGAERLGIRPIGLSTAQGITIAALAEALEPATVARARRSAR